MTSEQKKRRFGRFQSTDDSDKPKHYVRSGRNFNATTIIPVNIVSNDICVQ